MAYNPTLVTIIVVLVAAIAIGLGLGLGIGLSKPGDPRQKAGEWIAVGNQTADTFSSGNIQISGLGRKWESLEDDDYGSGTDLTQMWSIDHSGDRWVIGGGRSDPSKSAIIYSDDGRNWKNSTYTDSGTSTIIKTVAYGGGSWLAGRNIYPSGIVSANNYGNIRISTDGIDWSTESSSGVSFGIVRSIAYGTCSSGPSWVAYAATFPVVQTGNQLFWSNDGSSWNPSSGDGFQRNDFEFGGVAYSENQGRWVVTGFSSGTITNQNILWSDNGTCWVYSTSNGDYHFRGNDVAYGKDKWVSVGSASAGERAILYSTDGKTWNQTNGNEMTTVRGVHYGNDLWMAVGLRSDGVSVEETIVTSTNGISWTPLDSGNGGFGSGGVGAGGNAVAYKSS